MKTLFILIAGWIWNIIKAILVYLILSLIWPDIETETVLAVITLYTVVTTIRNVIKKKR